MQQYKNLIINNNNLNCFFFDVFLNTLNESVIEYEILDEGTGTFDAWLSSIPQSILNGWNWFKGLITGRDNLGKAFDSSGEAATIIGKNESILNKLNTIKTQIQNIEKSGGRVGSKLLNNQKILESKLGNSSEGLAGYFPESVRVWIRDNGNLTTGVAISAGVLGLIYLYKKFISNPNKPPDRQTIQYAQKLNNMKVSDLSLEIQNKTIL